MNGITVEELRAKMQRAINEAWTLPPDEGGITAACQQQVPCEGDIPTPEEFIGYVANEIRKIDG